jgi:hypothetical protein
MVRFFRTSFCLLATAAIAVLTPLAATGAPVTQALTPPPPPFEICKTVGAGTICQGSRTESIAAEDTGITCGVGASAFNIVDSSTNELSEVRYYDRSGNLTRLVIHNQYLGQWSNAATGAAAPYKQTNNTTFDLAVPGDFSSSTQTVTGEIIMRAGPGAPVLIAVGRQVYGPNGELLSSAGRNDIIAGVFEGDPAAFAAVCAALT